MNEAEIIPSSLIDDPNFLKGIDRYGAAREFPDTPEGHDQMRIEEDRYWELQKSPIRSFPVKIQPQD